MVPVAKMELLRDTLSEWPSDRAVASEVELYSLIDPLLHVHEVVRPGTICCPAHAQPRKFASCLLVGLEVPLISVTRGVIPTDPIGF